MKPCCAIWVQVLVFPVSAPAQGEPRVAELVEPLAPDEIHAAEQRGAIPPGVILSGVVPFVVRAPDATPPWAQEPAWLPHAIPVRGGVRCEAQQSRETQFSVFPQ